MPSRLTLSERISTLRGAFPSFAAVASHVGVSERTLRRWKNQGVTPSPARAESVKVLIRDSAKERKRMIARARREGVEPFPVPVLLEPHRVKHIAREISDTVDYKVPRWMDIEGVSQVISAYRNRRDRQGKPARFRIIVFLTMDFESDGVVVSGGGKTMLEWEEINDWSDDEILEYLYDAVGYDDDSDTEPGRVVLIRTIDNAAQRTANRPHNAIGEKASKPLAKAKTKKQRGKKAVRKTGKKNTR